MIPQPTPAELPLEQAAREHAAAFRHGDLVRHRDGGYADQHKVLGVELNRYGQPQVVVWDYRSASVWCAAPDMFVRLTDAEIEKGRAYNAEVRAGQARRLAKAAA